MRFITYSNVPRCLSWTQTTISRLLSVEDHILKNEVNNDEFAVFLDSFLHNAPRSTTLLLDNTSDMDSSSTTSLQLVFTLLNRLAASWSSFPKIRAYFQGDFERVKDFCNIFWLWNVRQCRFFVSTLEIPSKSISAYLQAVVSDRRERCSGVGSLVSVLVCVGEPLLPLISEDVLSFISRSFEESQDATHRSLCSIFVSGVLLMLTNFMSIDDSGLRAFMSALKGTEILKLVYAQNGFDQFNISMDVRGGDPNESLVQDLQGIFPEVPRDLIVTALNASTNNVENAATLILEGRVAVASDSQSAVLAGNGKKELDSGFYELFEGTIFATSFAGSLGIHHKLYMKTRQPAQEDFSRDPQLKKKIFDMYADEDDDTMEDLVLDEAIANVDRAASEEPEMKAESGFEQRTEPRGPPADPVRARGKQHYIRRRGGTGAS
eukprot:ANDGO_04238.mRNA.1 hypothetical protein